MKNILKTIAVLVSASLISVAAKAGELTVTGSAKASYVMGSGFNDNGKAIGISNELNTQPQASWTMGSHGHTTQS